MDRLTRKDIKKLIQRLVGKENAKEIDKNDMSLLIKIVISFLLKKFLKTNDSILN